MLPAAISDLAIVILAGGRASRFPGKLEAPIAGEPLLARVYRSASRPRSGDRCRTRHVFAAARRAAGLSDRGRSLARSRTARRIAQRGAGERRGAHLRRRRRRTVRHAGEVLDALRGAWRDGDQAAVPEHGGRLEPLAALYDRSALIREAHASLGGNDLSMHGMLARLRIRAVPMDERYFANVNTAADLPLGQG